MTTFDYLGYAISTIEFLYVLHCLIEKTDYSELFKLHSVFHFN